MNALILVLFSIFTCINTYDFPLQQFFGFDSSSDSTSGQEASMSAPKPHAPAFNGTLQCAFFVNFLLE